jgi:hypothetical protein
MVQLSTSVYLDGYSHVEYGCMMLIRLIYYGVYRSPLRAGYRATFSSTIDLPGQRNVHLQAQISSSSSSKSSSSPIS